MSHEKQYMYTLHTGDRNRAARAAALLLPYVTLVPMPSFPSDSKTTRFVDRILEFAHRGIRPVVVFVDSQNDNLCGFAKLIHFAFTSWKYPGLQVKSEIKENCHTIIISKV